MHCWKNENIRILRVNSRNFCDRIHRNSILKIYFTILKNKIISRQNLFVSQQLACFLDLRMTTLNTRRPRTQTKKRKMT